MRLEEKVISSIGTGEENGVSLAELMNITGLRNRPLRKLIEYLRRKGVVICSNSHGYFKPSTLVELKCYIMQERARARSIYVTIESAEKLSRNWRN